MSYMICLYLQDSGLFLARGSSLGSLNQRPVPASVAPLKCQIAVTLAVGPGTLAQKERGSFWSLEMEPASRCVDVCQHRKKKSVSYDSPMCPLWDRGAGRWRITRLSKSTWAGFGWTAKGSGGGEEGKIECSGGEKVTQLQAWLICCVEEDCFHSWMSPICPGTP